MNNTTIFACKGVMLTAVLSFFSSFESKAQEQLGLINSNFSGTNAVYLNPANIATPFNIAYVNLWSRGIGFQNDFLKYNAPFKINKWANDRIPDEYLDTYGNFDFKQSWLKQINLNGNAKNFNFNQDIRALSLMLPVGEKTFISLNLRQRTGIQIQGLDEDLARVARYGINNTKFDLFGNAANQLQYGKELGTKSGFKAHFESWQEYSFSLGGVIKESKTHLLSGGITLKYLRGMGLGHLSSSNLSFTVENGDSVTLNAGSFDYAHTQENAMMKPLIQPVEWFDQATTGHGVGLDIGFNWMKKRSRSSFRKSGFWDWGCNYYQQYDWKFGAALMDLGFIQHRKGVNAYNVDFSSPFGLGVRTNMLNGFTNAYRDGFDDVDADLINRLPASDVTNKNTFTSYLPAAFTAQGDFRLGNRTYLGINYQQSLKSTTSFGLNAANFISFIPRIEGYFAEAALPITVSNTFKNINVGFYTKLWIFHIGSDNLGGLLNLSANKEFTGASLYGGFSLPIPYCTGGSWVENRTNTKIYHYPEEEKPEDKPKDETKPDSVIQQQPDTVYITVRDTVQVPQQNPDWEKKELEYKNKQKELEKRIEELENKKPNTTANCVECEKNLRNERINNEKTRKDLVYERERNINLERENNTLKERLHIIETQKIKCENDRTANLREIDNLNKKISAIELELADCRKRTTPERPDEEVKRLNDKIVQLENDKKNLETQRDKCNKTNDELTVKITQLQNDADKCKKELEEYKARVEKLNKENEKLNIDITKARDSIKMLQAKITDGECNKKLDELNNKIISLETDKKKCDEENAKKEVVILNYKKDIEAKDKRIKELSDSLNAIVIKLKSCNEQYDNALREYQYAMQQVKDLQKQLKDCQDKAQSGNNSGGNNDAEIQALQKKLDDANDQVKTLEAKVVEQQTQLSNMQSKQDELNKKLKDCEDSKSNLDQTAKIKELETKITDLQNKLDKYQSDLTQSQNKVKDLEAKIQQCENEKGKLGTGDNQDADKRIAEIEKEKSSLQQQLDEANKQLQTKENEFANLKKQVESQKLELANCKKNQSNFDKVLHDKDSIQRANIQLQNDLRNCRENKEGQGNVIPGTNTPSETKGNSSSVIIPSGSSQIPGGINGGTTRTGSRTSTNTKRTTETGNSKTESGTSSNSNTNREGSTNSNRGGRR